MATRPKSDKHYELRSLEIYADNLYSTTYLSLGRRCDVRVPRLADDVLNAADRDGVCGRNAGERVSAVVREVPVDLPRLSEVVRPFDEHGSRSESLESHDEMCEVELGFEVELQAGLLPPVLRLPPAQLPVGEERRDDVLDAVAVGIVAAVRLTRVADEALVDLVLQMADDAVALWPLQTARRRRRQLVLATDEQVSGGRVATALFARTDGRDGTRSLPGSLLGADSVYNQQTEHYVRHLS